MVALEAANDPKPSKNSEDSDVLNDRNQSIRLHCHCWLAGFVFSSVIFRCANDSRNANSPPDKSSVCASIKSNCARAKFRNWRDSSWVSVPKRVIRDRGNKGEPSTKSATMNNARLFSGGWRDFAKVIGILKWQQQQQQQATAVVIGSMSTAESLRIRRVRQSWNNYHECVALWRFHNASKERRVYWYAEIRVSSLFKLKTSFGWKKKNSQISWRNSRIKPEWTSIKTSICREGKTSCGSMQVRKSNFLMQSVSILLMMAFV